MPVVPNPSPVEILNILVVAGFTGFMIALVITLLVFVWYFGKAFAQKMG